MQGGKKIGIDTMSATVLHDPDYRMFFGIGIGNVQCVIDAAVVVYEDFHRHECLLQQRVELRSQVFRAVVGTDDNGQAYRLFHELEMILSVCFNTMPNIHAATKDMKRYSRMCR